MSQAAFVGYSWLQGRVAQKGFPVRGNFSQKLPCEVALRFCDEVLVLPAGTTVVAYRRVGRSHKVWTYATLFIAGTPGCNERQVSVLSDSTLHESRLDYQVQCRRLMPRGVDGVRSVA